jgi:hypothetical protein
MVHYLAANIPYTYYPNAYPASAPDECARVVVQPGADAERDISRPSLQIVVRAPHPQTAEDKAWEILNFLKNKTDFMVGSVHVVYCRAESAPLYMGPDSSGRVEYSLNFRLITEGQA